MMRLSKKILTALLMVCLLLSTSQAAFATGLEPENDKYFSVKSSEPDDQNFYYEITNSTEGNLEVAFVSTIVQNPPSGEYSTYTGEVSIPSKVSHNNKEYTVTAVGASAFRNSTVTKVTIPDTVKSISSGAFDGCKQLTEVTLGTGVETIGDNAFLNCAALTTINLPNGLTTIGGSAFAKCTALKTLTLPDTVTSIGGGAFNGSGLTAITIPANVTEGLGSVLSSFPNISGITIANGSPYAIDNGVLYKGTTLENVLDKTVNSVTVREGTTAIGASAFYTDANGGCAVTNVTIPDSVTEIGSSAFRNCQKLTTLDLPDQLQTIGTQAFADSTALTSIEIPASVTTLQSQAFRGCTSLTSIVVPEDITTLPESIFTGCTALTNVELPSTLTTIGKSAFSGCTGLKNFEVPAGVTEIGESAFASARLTSLVIPASVQTIGTKAFNKAFDETGSPILVFQGASAPTLAQTVFGGNSDRKPTAPPSSLSVAVPVGSESSYSDTILKDKVSTTDNSYSYALSTSLDKNSGVVGDTFNLSITSTLPTGATLSVNSSNTNVATVSETGNTSRTIMAVGSGTANITASIVLNGVTLVTDSCTVTVTQKPVPAEGISLDRTSLSLYSNSSPRTATLTATVTPTDSTDAVSWTSSDETVATVDENGVVTAVGNGTATITAKAGNYSASCMVRVSTYVAPTPTPDPTPDPEPETPPVTTDDNTGTTETTAKPDVTVSGGTASATVSDDMGEEIVNQATENDSQTVIIAPEMDADTTSTEVTLPAATVDSIGTDTNADIVISTPVADVTLPNGGLSDLASAGGNITVSASVQGNTVALSVTADGEPVSSVTGGVTLVVPASDTTAGTVAVIVHDDGTREVVRKSVAADDSVTIPLSGSATVEIIDNSKDFDDVSADAWYSDVVDFASSHELFNGTSATTFSPNDAMTRGMLAAVLANLESADVSGMQSAFNDVHDEEWYSESVAWAAENGIVNGYGDGAFGPNDAITREQLAAMLYNYADMLGLDTTARASLAGYNDQPSAWATDVMQWAVAEGLITGTSSNTLDPQGTATRAQVAAMLQRFIENVL